jgi:hypothetical protein
MLPKRCIYPNGRHPEGPLPEKALMMGSFNDGAGPYASRAKLLGSDGRISVKAVLVVEFSAAPEVPMAGCSVKVVLVVEFSAAPGVPMVEFSAVVVLVAEFSAPF